MKKVTGRRPVVIFYDSWNPVWRSCDIAIALNGPVYDPLKGLFAQPKKFDPMNKR